MSKRNVNRAGFTLVELMIVVAIMGILASVAIPAYIRFQLQSKRAEAFANLSAIAKAEKSYLAEYNVYTGVPVSQPGPAPTGNKRIWGPPAEAAFAQVGWDPEGAVYFDYDVNVDASLCPGLDCFTTAAYGNLDDNPDLSVLVYVQPSPAGVFAPQGNGALGALVPPIEPITGRVELNEVALATPQNVF